MSFDALLKRSEDWTNLTKLESYYNGESRLDALGVSLPPEMRVLEMVAPWPKLSVDVLNEVLTVEGFTLAEDSETPKLLRKWWQANDLDTVVPLTTGEALVQGLGFFIVGPGEGETPRITGHRKAGMAVSYDHMGKVSEAVRKYSQGEDKFAAHYQPGRTDYYGHTNTGWKFQRSVDSGTSRVPVVPVVNKLRLGDTNGRSEMLEVMKLADAASRSLTNLQVAQELLALPQRWLFADGLQNMKDQSGNPVSQVEAYLGRLLTGPEGAKAGQFPGADLTQIINTFKLYAQTVSAITGIPPSFLGISTDNPTSAEAMRASKERLITRAETKQALFGDPIEETMRIGLDLAGKDLEGMETLEATWRDPATPSQSAKAANALQAHAQGVVTAETARDALNLTPEQKARENKQDVNRAALSRSVGL